MPTTTSSSRRRLTAVLAALVLVAAPLTGCASAAQEARSGTSSAGDTLRIGLTTDLLSAKPFSNASQGTDVLIGLVYDSLVDYPKDGLTPQPRLATSWKLAADGKSLTLQLRKGVRFHTGRAFTSQDVEFSIKKWADPAWAVQFQRTAAAITTFDTSDPHAITLGFAHPLTNVFDLLDALPIVDSKTFDQLKAGKRYVGTGPYEFDKWTPGSKLTFSRNDSYWGGKPKIAAVDAEVVTDQQALVSQLRSGQLDAVIGASNRDVQDLAKQPAYAVDSLKGAESGLYVGATLQNKALADVRVRKAISTVIDRSRIVSDVLRGTGAASDLPWPSYSPAYDAKANATYTRDVAAAKKLIAAATAKGALPTVPLEYQAGNSTYEATAQIVQANLAQIGIKVDLEPVEPATFIKELIGAQFKGLWVTTHGYAQYTPSTLAVSAYPFNAEHNASHFLSKAYATHADAAWEALTPAQEKQAYQALNTDLLDNQFLIEIATFTAQIAHSKRLTGLSWSKRGEIDLRNASLGGSSS